MRLGREYRGLTGIVFVTLVGLALTALILNTGSIPHTHVGPQVGLYNGEHDLVYLATFGSGAPLPEGTPAAVDTVAADVPGCVLVPLPASIPHRLADSRAPPASA